MAAGHPYDKSAAFAVDWANGQVVAVTATSAQSAAITAPTVVLSSTTACWITSAADPTATADTADNLYLPANTLLVLKITPGYEIAAVRESADGHLSILPVS